MNHTFYLSKSVRNIALLGFPFFAGMAGLFLFIILDKQPLSLSFALFGACFFGLIPWAMLCVDVYLLLCYFRYRLTTTNESFELRGVLSTKSIDLTEVTELWWNPFPKSGSIRLRSPTTVLRIPFAILNSPGTQDIVRLLRLKLPRSIQHDWPLFCLRYAELPDGWTPKSWPASEGKLVTRRFYDVTFPILLAVVLPICVYCDRQFQTWRVTIVFACLISAIWGLSRWIVPRDGYVVRTNRRPASTDRFTGRIFAGLCCFLFLSWLIERTAPLNYRLALQGCTALLFLIVTLCIAWRMDLKFQAEVRLWADEAVVEWEKLNPPLS